MIGHKHFASFCPCSVWRMPQTILVQSPVMERTNQNHSHGRISQTVDRRLMRFLILVLTSMFTTVAFAAQYIYYGGGLQNPAVEVENRLSYGIFHDCVDKWNSTYTPVEITQVPGSGNSYIISGQWDDTWHGISGMLSLLGVPAMGNNLVLKVHYVLGSRSVSRKQGCPS